MQSCSSGAPSNQISLERVNSSIQLTGLIEAMVDTIETSAHFRVGRQQEVFVVLHQGSRWPRAGLQTRQVNFMFEILISDNITLLVEGSSTDSSSMSMDIIFERARERVCLIQESSFFKISIQVVFVAPPSDLPPSSMVGIDTEHKQCQHIPLHSGVCVCVCFIGFK